MRIIVGLDAAEEVHHIMIGGVANMHVAEEDHDVSLDCAVGIHVAEEAHCIVNRRIPGDVYGAAKLDFVSAGVCRKGKGCQRDREQTEVEPATFHDVSSDRYAGLAAEVPARSCPLRR